LNNKKTVCFGIKNSHEPNFFNSFRKLFDELGYNQIATARDYIEVVELVKKMKIRYRVIGKHYGQKKFNKVKGLILNDIEYLRKSPSYDVSLSHGNATMVHNSWFYGKKSIVFTDNDLNFRNHMLYFPFLSHLIVPNAIDKSLMIKHGVKESKLITYDGIKENIYIADYRPDPYFLNQIPFKEFVTVRAESLQAIYVPQSTQSIVPDLFKRLEDANINVLFCPRYESDKEYARGFGNIYMPPAPINGLDACYYSKAVLTGAGTFAREAACMGTPAVSFFPGRKLLSVDEKLISEGKVFHSRNPDEIVSYVIGSSKIEPNLEDSKKVQNQVFDIVRSCIN